MDSKDIPISSPKKRLMDAKEQDAYFDRVVKDAEAQQVAKIVSQSFVTNALESALSHFPNKYSK